LVRAVVAIQERYGRFSVSATGGYITQAVIATAKRLRLDFEQVAIEIEGHGLATCDPTVRTTVKTIPFEEFSKFAIQFGLQAGCSDPWVALEGFHATASVLPHIFDGAELRIINHGYDQELERSVGPADLALADGEKFTAINRWLMHEQRTGFPQILRWSPELIAAQLDSERFRRWIAGVLRGDDPVGTRSNRSARIGLVRENFPGIVLWGSARRARKDKKLNARMRGLARRMRRASPGCRTQQYSPLGRVMEHFQLPQEPGLIEGPSPYGYVHAS
jgi:hypothetical protein